MKSLSKIFDSTDNKDVGLKLLTTVYVPFFRVVLL